MKRFFFWVFLLGIMGILAYGLTTATRWPSSECENFFSNPIYSSYHNQLITLTENSQNLFKFSSEETSKERRRSHEQFIHALRQEIEVGNSPFIEKVVLGLFLEVDLSKQMQEYLFSMIAPPNSLGALDEYLLKSHHELYEKLTSSEKEHQSHIAWEDQFLSGNIPYRIKAKDVALIRIAQPLIDRTPLPWLFVKPSLSPEFRFFLEHQPSHLYVNLMKRHGKEGTLSIALEGLENEIPGLSVVTLDRDSSFYWQENAPEFADSDEFKSLFLSEMLDGNKNYFWSQQLGSSWPHQLEKIIHATHQRYFGNRQTLKKNERLDLIELVHVSILDALLNYLDPASMNITCRQAMDRAPALQSIWLLHRNDLTVEEMVALLLTPPMIIHNRTSHLSRIERLNSAAYYLINQD